MPDPSRLRDSTQIVLPQTALDGITEDLDDEFAVSIMEVEDHYRIVGSPVEIKAASDYLARHGVSVP